MSQAFRTQLASVIPKEWMMVEPCLRRCYACGSTRRRWLYTLREVWGSRRHREVIRTAIVQCRNSGCGTVRWVRLAR